MALSRERMMDRMLASDETFNGRFITGVLSTGIYCLPSCHARKPKPENVRFFRSTQEARKAGLRPCKLCKPDEFEQGIDTDLERLEHAADAVRLNPRLYDTVDSIADEVAISPSTLHQQFRQHYQTSPGSFLIRSRIDCARRKLIESREDAAQIGLDVGFDSTSGFYDSFRKLTGMTPAGYRGLSSVSKFKIALPDRYPVQELLKVFSRDPGSISESLNGNSYRIAHSRNREPNLLTMKVFDQEVECRVDGDALAAHEIAIRVLNLRQDPGAFERQATEIGFERLVRGRHGLRISQTPTVFEGLIWVIVGQQINFPFAATLRRRLIEMVGVKNGDLVCIPEPEAIARLEPADLLKVQFSRQKAEYLIGAARLVAGGELNLNDLEDMSATRTEQILKSVRGLGVWSVNYLMMRSLSFADCVPLGDTGISSGLQRLYKLDHRPKAEECSELLRPFAPYRSLACYHLWRSGSKETFPEPE